MRPLDLLLAVLIMAIWGFNFVAVKVGIEQLPPIFFTFFRFALVALALAPFVARPKGQWGKLLAISFTLAVLHFAMMFTALVTLDASTAAIAIQIQVPFAALLAWLIYRERLGWWRALGMAIAFSGVILIAGEPRLGDLLLPFFMVIASAMCWAVGNLIIKTLRPIDGLSLNAWVAVLAAPQLLAASFLLEDGQWQALTEADWLAWLAVLYQSLFVYFIGYTLWFRLLRRYPVNQTMPVTLLVPPFGVLFSVVFLGDTLTWALIVGGLLTVGGVAVMIFTQPKAEQAIDRGDS